MKTGILVGLGAALGALARWALTGCLPVPEWTTLAINVVGCLLFGYYQPGSFWGTGVLGGFTTMSTYAWYAVGAVATLVATPVLCVGAAMLGRWARCAHNHDRDSA